MQEREVRQQLYNFIRVDLNSAPITQTDASRCENCGHLTKPPIGRPDILVNPAYVVEVKTLRPDEKSFPMDRIDDRQRKWLNRWYDRDRPGYIGLGVIRKHGTRDYLEHLYLVPWRHWRQAEDWVRQYQASIPLEAGKGYKRELQEQNLDILHLFAEWELIQEGGRWHLPPTLQEIMECERQRES